MVKRVSERQVTWDFFNSITESGYASAGYNDQSAMDDLRSVIGQMDSHQAEIVTGAIAHIFNNKLAVIMSNLSMLHDDGTSDDEMVTDALDAAKQVRDAVADLRKFVER